MNTVTFEQALRSVLSDYRITLRRYGIEFLYEDLIPVECEETKVKRFLRKAIGQVVQYSRESTPVVTVQATENNEGQEILIQASREGAKSLKLSYEPRQSLVTVG